MKARIRIRRNPGFKLPAETFAYQYRRGGTYHLRLVKRGGFDRPEALLDAFGLIDRAAALGVEVVQIADNLPVDALSALDLARLARYLELALATGARLVRTLTHRKDSTPDLPQVETFLRESLPAYERAGVTLALENYERHTSAELAALIRNVDSPSLGACLDTVNSLGALETPAEIVCRLAPFTANLHVKDFEIKRVPSMMGYLVTGCPAGTGRLDVPWLLAEMRRCGRDPSIIIEQWPPFSDTIGDTVALEAAWAEQSVRYLQTCIRD